ncbi:hypothetical protein TCDM_04941 [Trypanosoma cruzi Dm28c]|uniref:Uncharacterized protein n=1 Tax=Trypanosoma cruzi Dm28c TaxID=1416333 RepID=V5BJX5_TRYCR|nr:hypothetical protein TCDM_04941 [Trypanosoma cruzi Dm28c]
MGRITRLDGEHGVEVSGLFLPERVLPDRLNERSINPLLQLRTVITDDSLRCRLRRLFGLLLRRFLRLVTHKLTLRLHALFLLRALEDVGGDAAHVHIFDVHLRRRRNDVARVDATDRHAVVFHGPGDDQRTVAGQLLQDHHTAATEATSKDDGDGAGLAALAQRCVLGALAAHFLGNLPGGSFLLSGGHRPRFLTILRYGRKHTKKNNKNNKDGSPTIKMKCSAGIHRDVCAHEESSQWSMTPIQKEIIYSKSKVRLGMHRYAIKNFIS